jgi:hypothetical protein
VPSLGQCTAEAIADHPRHRYFHLAIWLRHRLHDGKRLVIFFMSHCSRNNVATFANAE